MAATPVDHVWILGKPLCGLEVKTADAGQAACGSCMLLVSRIRREAAALLKLHGGAVRPAQPSRAWAALRRTPWAEAFDLEEFLSRPDLDQTIRFEALVSAVDAATVDAVVDEWQRAGSTDD